VSAPTPAAPADPGARTLLAARLIPHPRERVFAAFTDPARLARWWGPKDFTNTFELCDFRPGGAWRFTMHAPGGSGHYPNECRFAGIVAPERVVIDHLSAPHFQLTVTLHAQGAQTRVEWRQVFETAEVCEAIRKLAGPGNEQNLERLEAEAGRL
jgi:uncharacterized protein YndB with AHSA1/START domain